jgi:hypothetical protein
MKATLPNGIEIEGTFEEVQTLLKWYNEYMNTHFNPTPVGPPLVPVVLPTPTAPKWPSDFTSPNQQPIGQRICICPWNQPGADKNAVWGWAGNCPMHPNTSYTLESASDLR